ncbi:MAG: type II toxin-antitoxin system prevent-host-death family antitoxin [Dehalococcoidia bacterium]|jgi:antitoxin (DNA-binding transcriptional repressor) of toxin-antitoxin stability system
MKTVGVYEAKTHLARLLDEVEKGECITITRHGKPVAVLKAPERSRYSPEELLQRFRQLRTTQRPLGIPIKDLINEGRRF